jgi:hypothetical protein
MKLFVLTFLLSFNSFAVTEVMYAKYGAADRDLNSMPYVNASKDAEKLMKALAAPQAGNKKIIEATDGSLECTDFSTGTKKAFTCEFMMDVTRTNARMIVAGRAARQVTFYGKIAQEIYDSMTATVTRTTGMTFKKVGNITCGIGSGIPRKMRCTLTNTLAWTIKE